MTDLEKSKRLVRRLVEIVNAGDLEALDEVASGQIAEQARRWIGSFRDSFPDFHMEVRDVIAEGDKVTSSISSRSPRRWKARPRRRSSWRRISAVKAAASPRRARRSRRPSPTARSQSLSPRPTRRR
jgi:hypothetical protein